MVILAIAHRLPVAPLAGSVDRNSVAARPAARMALSLPSRGAWIEILRFAVILAQIGSLPSRGAWIEIQTHPGRGAQSGRVAPLAGSVDRN